VYHQADGDGSARTGGTPLGSPATEGIDLFKIANRSISGWVPSFKLSSAAVMLHGQKSKIGEVFCFVRR
jgi:hypothetical protein